MNTALATAVPQTVAEPDMILRSVPLLHFIRPELHDMARAVWWLHVEAMLLVNGNVHLAAFRREHKPTHGEYLDGKLNGLQFRQCVEVDDTTRPAMTLLYEAAERRMSLHKLTIFVSALPPWPGTERLAQSGIATLLYAVGSPSARDLEVLAAAGVELIHVV